MKKIPENTQKYIERTKRYKLLSSSEEYELGKLAQKGNRKAIDKLVVSNLRLVVKFAYDLNGYVNQRGITFDDLIQHGNFGLIKAAERYDPEQAKFSSYASWWIRSYMHTYIIFNFSIIKISGANNSRKMFFKCGKFVDEVLSFKVQDEREKARIRFSKKYYIDLKYVKDFEKRVEGFDVSMDKKRLNENDNPITLHDIINFNPDFDGQIAAKQDIEFIRHIIAQISFNERENLIIEKRIMSDTPMTLNDISEIYGVTRERIRQIEKQILRKFKVAVLESRNML